MQVLYRAVEEPKMKTKSIRMPEELMSAIEMGEKGDAP